MARLHIICGNCGSNDMFSFRVDANGNCGEDGTEYPSVRVFCGNCATLHPLGATIKEDKHTYSDICAALTSAREENERLTAENANLRAATRGTTFFHSDEEVNAETGRLRAENESLVKELRLTRLALDEERERCARIAINQAEAIRVANTYRGKVNQMADQAAFWCEQIAAEIINPPNPVITIPNTEQPST